MSFSHHIDRREHETEGENDEPTVGYEEELKGEDDEEEYYTSEEEDEYTLEASDVPSEMEAETRSTETLLSPNSSNPKRRSSRKSAKKDSNVLDDGDPSQKHMKARLYKSVQLQDVLDSLPEDIGISLNEFWTNMEKKYATTNLISIENIQRCHEQLLEYPQNFNKDYLQILEAPDARIQLSENFKSDFNRLRPSTRNDKRIKPILHKRINEFLVNLEGVTEEKYAKSKVDAYKLLKKGFLTTDSERMATNFGVLLQAQTDRFIDTIKFINDHYYNEIAVGLKVPNNVSWKDLADISLMNKALLCRRLENSVKCNTENDSTGATATGVKGGDCNKNPLWDDAELLKFLKGRGRDENANRHKSSSDESSSSKASCVCPEDQIGDDGFICNYDKELSDTQVHEEGGSSNEEVSGENEEEIDFGLDYTSGRNGMFGEMRHSFEFDGEDFGEDGKVENWQRPHPTFRFSEEEAEEGEESVGGNDVLTSKASEGEEYAKDTSAEETEEPHKTATSNALVQDGGKGGKQNRKSKVSSGKKAKNKNRLGVSDKDVKDVSKPPRKSKEKSEPKIIKGAEEETKRNSKSGGVTKISDETNEDEHFDVEEEEEEEEEEMSSHLEFTENELELDFEHGSDNSFSRHNRGSYGSEYGGEDWWGDLSNRGSVGSAKTDARGSNLSGLEKVHEPVISIQDNPYFMNDFFWDSDSSKHEKTTEAKEPSSAQTNVGICEESYDDEEYFDSDDVFYMRDEFFEKDIPNPRKMISVCTPPPAENNPTAIALPKYGDLQFQESLLHKLLTKASQGNEMSEEKTDGHPDKDELFSHDNNKSRSFLVEQILKGSTQFPVPIVDTTTDIAKGKSAKLPSLQYPQLSTTGPPALNLTQSFIREQGFNFTSPFNEDTNPIENNKTVSNIPNEHVLTTGKYFPGFKRPLLDCIATHQDEIWNCFETAVVDAKGNVDKVSKLIKDAISRGYPIESSPKPDQNAASTPVPFPLKAQLDLGDIPYAMEGPEPVEDMEPLDREFRHRKTRKSKRRGSKLYKAQAPKKMDNGGSTSPKRDISKRQIEPATVTPTTPFTAESKPGDTILSSGSPKSSLSPPKPTESVESMSDVHHNSELPPIDVRKSKFLLSIMDYLGDTGLPEGNVEDEKAQKRRKLFELLRNIPDGEDLPQVSEIKSKLRTKLKNWEKTLELEVERLVRQLTAIEERAQEELRRFKELPCQVWDTSKTVASNIYADDLKRDDEVGGIFRCATNAGSQLYGKFYIDRYDLRLDLSGTEDPIPLSYPEELMAKFIDSLEDNDEFNE